MKSIVCALFVSFFLTAGAVEPHWICGNGTFKDFNTYGNAAAKKIKTPDGRDCLRLQLGGINAQKAGALQFILKPEQVKTPDAYDSITIFYKGDGGTGNFVVHLSDKQNSWTWNGKCWEPAAAIPCYEEGWVKRILYLKDFKYSGSAKVVPKPELKKIRNIQLAIGIQLKEPTRKFAEIQILRVAYEKDAKEEFIPAPKKEEPKAAPVKTVKPTETTASSYALPSWVKWDVKKHFQKNTSSRSSISLNNYWQFRPVPESQVSRVVKERKGILPAIPDAVPKDGFHSYVRVPGRWDGTGFRMRGADRKEITRINGVPPADYVQGWLRRGFFAPDSWKGKRVQLQLKGIGEQCTVFVNGVPCGNFSQTGTAEIGAHLLFGKNNDISIFAQYSSLPLSSSHGRHKEFMNPGMGTAWWYRWHEGVGLTEDVWLHVFPEEIALNDLRILPEVSSGRIGADATLANKTKSVQKLILSGKILDGAKTVLNLPSNSVTLKPGETLRPGVSAAWKDAVCWSPENPKLYDFVLTLRTPDGKIVDELRDTFGYRELAIRNGDFVLNGKKIRLKFKSNQFRFGSLEEKELRIMLKSLKEMHFNGLILEAMSERTVRVCNEMGMMIALRHVMPALVRGGTYLPGVPNHGFPFEVYLSPRFEQAKRELESTLTSIVRTFRNDPAVVFWMLNPLLCWNPEWINPNRIDADQPENDLVRASMKEEAFLRKLDPTRLVVQSMGSNTGSVITANPYPTFENHPDEWADWPMKWAELKKKPLVLEEVAIPFCFNFATWFSEKGKNYTDWYGKKPLFYEQAARYFGDGIYKLSTPDQNESLWHSLAVRSVKTPDGVTYDELDPAAGAAHALWLERCLKAWRIYDISGIWPFEGIDLYFDTARTAVRTLPEPEDITAPGCKSDYAAGFDYSRKNAVHAATKLGQQPFLAFLGGRPERFTSLEHGYRSGEKIQKQMLFSNDALSTCPVKAVWKIHDGAKLIASGKWDGSLNAGEIRKIPFEWTAPAVSVRTEYVLSFQAESGKNVCSDSLKIQVFPPEKNRTAKKVVLYDENGSARKLLERMKIPYTENLNSLSGNGVLVVGSGSFSAAFLEKAKASGIDRKCRDGVSVLVLEQTAAGPMKDYLEERRVRHVFIKDAAHPVLKGFSDMDLHHWRGESGLLEPYPSTGTAVQNMRFMRWGTEGVVSSFVMDKPDSGRFNVLLDGDADLSRAALLEYPVGKGRMLFCQLDLSHRNGKDPAAALLANRIFAYLENPELYPVHPSGATGNASLFSDLKFRLEPFDPGKHKVLVWMPDSKFSAEKIREFVKNGGTVFVPGTDAKSAASLALPFQLTVDKEKVRFGGRPESCPLLRGLGNSDFYFSPAVTLNVFKTVPANAEWHSKLFASVPYGKGRYVFLTLKPSDFKEEASAIKVRRILSTILFRLGVPSVDSIDFANKSGDVILSGKKVPFRIDPDSKGVEKGWHKASLNESGWRMLELGTHWEGQGISMANPHYKHSAGLPYDGDAWYRIPVVIPSDWKGRALYFEAASIDDLDWVYFNGVQIGHTGEDTPDYWCARRLYRIPENLIRFGESNLISVRVRDLRGNGGIMGTVRVGGEKLQPGALFYSRPSRLIRDFDPNSWRQW